MVSQLDVFTLDEISRAAGVPRAAIRRLVESGELRPVPGFEVFDTRAAVRAGRLARRQSADDASTSFSAPVRREERGLSALASSLVHVGLLAAVIWTTSGAVDTSATEPRERLVFLAGPGPGGGGGGGGKAPRAPVNRISRPRPTAAPSLTPDPEPIPSRALVSPVVVVTGDDNPVAPEPEGSGAGSGPGLDEGTGGGSGGGPFRPGSGIEPPRLLREVKAQYTDDARTRGITGGVILEIVIKADGTVGDVSVLRGLGHGLDERAVAAVRHWKFSPARRLNAPVDVIVEVEVEFSLR